MFWPQFIQGVWLSLLFVPLTTVTMDPIPKEQMGNATSLFNLMRNSAAASASRRRARCSSARRKASPRRSART